MQTDHKLQKEFQDNSRKKLFQAISTNRTHLLLINPNLGV